MDHNENRSVNLSLDDNSSFYFASVFSGIILLLVFACSLTLNTVILWVLWKTKMLRASVYRLIGFILMNEILIRIFGSPFVITSMLSGRWLYLDFGCKFYAFVMSWLGVTTSSLFTCVAIERYIIMCQPKISHYLTVNTANMIGLACYIHGLIWAITPLLMENGYVYEPSRLSCTPDWSQENIVYILGLVCVCFIMPVMTSLVCYITIYKAIRGHTTRTRFNSTFDSNVAFNAAITLGTFLLAWTPYMCIALHKTFGMEERISISKEVTLIPLVAAKMAGLWHPIIFGLNNRDIRSVIRSELSRSCQTFCFTFCDIRLSRRFSSGRSKRIAQCEMSHIPNNEVSHKTNIYLQVDNVSSDERQVNSSSQTTTEV